jgi:nucleoside-diphosphate-sugar epimerase
MESALVLGGAGFIGSNICRHLAARGVRVIAVDGLMPRTSGNRANLAEANGDIELVANRVEEVKSFPDLLRGHDVVVDAMGWTSHWEAFDDPAYDLALNLTSHLVVIGAMPIARPRQIVYLASAHQYGRTANGPIAETQPLAPLDIQGIHKTAAEHHYRLAAERNGLSVVSLRFGNTFGPAQPLAGRDVGLIADMIRRALAGEAIEVFGEGRRRTVHYAPDLARMIEAVAHLELNGFVPINVPGRHVAIAELASQIASCTGGMVSQKPLPADVAAIDTGDAALDCALFEKYFGPPQLTPLPEAIKITVAYARAKLARAIDVAHPS